MQFLLIFLLVLRLSTESFGLDYDGWLNVHLDHSLGLDNDFTDRGNITIRSVRLNSFTIDQKPLRSDQLSKLEAAAAMNDLYSIRAIVQSNDGTESTFLTSMKASALLECNLHDTFSIWIAPSGSVLSVTAMPTNFDQFSSNENGEFKTQIFLRQIEQAPVPDTASYIQKLEREREARDKGEFKDNRSFLAKYWMYIVPVVLFVLISGAANPEQGAAR